MSNKLCGTVARSSHCVRLLSWSQKKNTVMANKKYKNPANPFKWKHARGEIIRWLVAWYCRYALSYRVLWEIALERGWSLKYTTIYRWVREYAPVINNRTKPYLKMTCDSWKCNETYLKIKGEWYYLYRAIDKEGNTLDWMLSRYRNKKAAKQFFKKTFRNMHIVSPRVVNVDKTLHFPRLWTHYNKKRLSLQIHNGELWNI